MYVIFKIHFNYPTVIQCKVPHGIVGLLVTNPISLYCIPGCVTSVQCAIGYEKTSGHPQYTCLHNGNWSSDIPTCLSQYSVLDIHISYIIIFLIVLLYY